MNQLRIYLDLCCFNRPFDNQHHKKIYTETEAKLYIQEKLKERVYCLIWSYILDFENNANPNKDARESIQKWEKIACDIVFESEKLKHFAGVLYNKGLGIKDALHVASAVEGRADYFFTVDKRILNKRSLIEEVRIINPVEFIAMEHKV